MKNFIHYIFLIVSALALVSCELDNYDGPDAQIHGKIVDRDGNLIPSDATWSGVKIHYYEQGDFTSPVKQALGLKPDGTYRNDMMFSGTYDFIITDANFAQIDTIFNYEVKPGDNTLDFTVDPYVTIKDLSVTQEGTNVIARFKMETIGNNTGKVDQIQLFAYLDKIVSIGAMFSLSPNNVAVKTIGRAPDPDEEFVLSFDLSNQGNTFSKYPTDTPFCFRVGALIDKWSASPASPTASPNPKWNYSNVVSMKLNL